MERILKHYTLQNGLRVAALPDDDAESACILVDIHSGSRDDRPGLAGEHHAFEHVPFRGCGKFRDKYSWVRPLERYGVDIANNINTGLCRTRYSLGFPTQHFELGAEHLSALVYRPLMRTEDWAAEAKVVIKEWEAAQNNLAYPFLHTLLPILFPNSPELHSSSLGTPESIERITISDLSRLHLEEYTINNSHIIVTGKLNEDWLTILEEHFGSLKLLQGSSHNLPVMPEPVAGQRHVGTHPLFRQPMTGLYGLFPTASERALSALHLFKVMLGVLGTMSTPLFLELREHHQLIYNYGLYVKHMLPQLLRISFEYPTSLDNVEKVERMFWEIIGRTLDDREQFGFAKDRALAKMEMEFPDADDDADEVADQLLYRGAYTPFERERNTVSDLSFEEVQTVAAQYFNKAHFCTLTMKLPE